MTIKANVEVGEGEVKCPRCNGSGVDLDEDRQPRVCAYCDGDGKVPEGEVRG